MDGVRYSCVGYKLALQSTALVSCPCVLPEAPPRMRPFGTVRLIQHKGNRTSKWLWQTSWSGGHVVKDQKTDGAWLGFWGDAVLFAGVLREYAVVSAGDGGAAVEVEDLSGFIDAVVAGVEVVIGSSQAQVQIL
ncbi:hypothetical protein BG015_011541 [Linnemannia schmuckeri]|uniref:Uncharacterized protein n=1 Tax=Linnemannia schmuckeri TaxID=64567 RepID=A0A9P5S4L4_9FUNG|nr:hypothetical protein BG015_011541 [Linnemannia schmuckeri]